MVAMPTQDYIKHLYEVEGLSLREIARRTQLSWSTVRKYAQRDDWNGAEPTRRRQPVMDAWSETVDTWLAEDRLAPRKQRRCAAQIFRDLKKLGFPGSERTVREYVSRRKRLESHEAKTPFVELAHAPGSAQADFGTASVIHHGEQLEIRPLTLSFPHSNAGFDYPLPAENQECFLEGLKRLFERLGGVPRCIRLDNLSAAVVTVGPGESRTLTDGFLRFKNHYRFEVEFCGPARGNEKGHVENKVGYTRRAWLSPPPVMEDYAALAERLWADALADMQRPHYKKGVSIAELWEADRAALLPLPAIPFEVARLDRATLDNYGRFRWDRNPYDVPQGHPGQRLLLKITWDRIEVRDETQQLMTTLRRAYPKQPTPIDWAAHFEVYARRPRAVTSAAYFVHLPESVQTFLKAPDSDERARRVRHMRELLKRHPLERVAEALKRLPLDQHRERDRLEQLVYGLDPSHKTPAPLPEAHTPVEVAQAPPAIHRYDRLTPFARTGVSA